MFRDLKAGDTLYVFNRQTLELTTHKIVSVSLPRIEKVGMSTSSVVDVNVENTTYTLVDSSEIGFNGNLVISYDTKLVSREVENRLANNKHGIASVDTLKAEVPKLEEIIDMLNPEIKEKKQTDERLSSLEKQMDNINDSLKQILNAMNVKKGGTNGKD